MNPFSKIFLFCGLFLPIFSCREKQQKPDVSQLILSLQQTGQLVTTEYTLTKVIRASDDRTWYKWGDRKILINCEANLKAGVDLEQITTHDFIKQKDTSITISLPHAKLFSLSIPPDKIRVAYEETGFLRDPFSAGEREQLVAQAEPQIKSLVASLGILQTTENNAALFVKRLFQNGGYKTVNVVFE